jgi:hypothetical protein
MLVHFVSLLVQTWQNFVSSLGNTTLGFFLPTIVVPAMGFLLAIVVILAREGKAALVDHLKKTLGLAAIVALVGEFIVYGIVVGYTFTKTVYHDHEYLKGVASRYRGELGQKEVSDAASFAPIRTDLTSQINTLTAKCSKEEGVSETLDRQTRTQQDTINNCQTQAMKLLTPEPQKITILPWQDDVSDEISHKATYLLITNKEVTPVHIDGACDVIVSKISAQPVGIGSYSGGADLTGTPVTRGKLLEGISPFSITFGTPAWTPVSPIRMDITYESTKTAICRFVVR